MEDRGALEIGRLSVLGYKLSHHDWGSVLLSRKISENLYKPAHPPIDITVHMQAQTHRADTTICVKATWLSLHVRDPSRYGDTTSSSVTLCLMIFYYSCISKRK